MSEKTIFQSTIGSVFANIYDVVDGSLVTKEQMTFSPKTEDDCVNIHIEELKGFQLTGVIKFEKQVSLQFENSKTKQWAIIEL